MAVDPTRPRGAGRKPKRSSAVDQTRIAELEAQVADLLAAQEAAGG